MKVSSDESCVSGKLFISMSVGNSRLNLVTALKDVSNAGVVQYLENISLHLICHIYTLSFLVQDTRLFVLSKKPTYHHRKTLKL